MPIYVFEELELSVPEVAHLWAVPERTIRQWAKTSVLRAIPKQGRCRWKFKRSDVMRATHRLSRVALSGGRHVA
jgi:excisionase family DNA binding protein